MNNKNLLLSMDDDIEEKDKLIEDGDDVEREIKAD